MLKVDCGEFQMEHEVAKLIGAPPGYLGHRETQPMLTQQKLSAVTSEGSNLSLVLFDEIEKAAPSMTRLLLGVLDKATLRLGDNTTVNFERTHDFPDQQPGRGGHAQGALSGLRLRVDGARDHGRLAREVAWPSSPASEWARCGASFRRSSSTASTR